MLPDVLHHRNVNAHRSNVVSMEMDVVTSTQNPYYSDGNFENPEGK